MKNILCLIIGFIIGVLVGVTIMCLLQIDGYNKTQQELYNLKQKVKENNDEDKNEQR